MTEAPFGLTDRESEILRLLMRGHDAKSVAATLGLSVHTINERLREARQKTGASSSRGAARLLAAREGTEFPVPQQLGVPQDGREAERSAPLHPGAATGLRLWGRWGISVMISAILAAAIVIGLGDASDHEPAAPVAPTVVATMPATGAIVAAGPITLSVTFDRPMRRQSYSFVQKSPETYPDCAGQPRQSPDGRTFTIACRVMPGRRYEVLFNSLPYMNFVSDGGVPAVPYVLHFRTR